MEHPPAAVINAIPISQNNPVPSITPRYFLTSISTLTFQTYISTTTYYIAYYLSLHGIWFNRYRLSLNPDSDLELNTPPTSRRQYWTKSLQGMSIAWSQISVVSTTILGVSVTFLPMDDVWSNIYPRTSFVLALVLSFASLIASCIFIASVSNLDCDDKSGQWEIASHNPTAPSSVDTWACLALPLTFLAWSANFFLVALFSSMWTRHSAHSTQIDTGASKMDLAAVSIVVLFLLFPFYRLYEFLTKLSPSSAS